MRRRPATTGREGSWSRAGRLLRGRAGERAFRAGSGDPGPRPGGRDGAPELDGSREASRSRVTLVDLSVEMLRVARRRLSVGNGRFEFRNMDYARKPLPEGYDSSSLRSRSTTSRTATRRSCSGRYSALSKGGYFVNADQVHGETPEEEALYREWWPGACARRGDGGRSRRGSRPHEGRQERHPQARSWSGSPRPASRRPAARTRTTGSRSTVAAKERIEMDDPGRS